MKIVYKIGVRMLILLVPFFVVCPLLISHFPMRFFDEDYPMFIQNKEYGMRRHENAARILIMGDSTAKASWLPSLLTEDTYNYALGGMTAIEEYYCLASYLKHNDAPESIIYMQDPAHFFDPNYFWSRAVYFHRFEADDFRDLLYELNNFEDTSVLGGNDIQTEVFLYQTYSPSKYITSFLWGGVSPGRYRQNIRNYKKIVGDRGWKQFGFAERCDEQNLFATFNSFQKNEIIDSYFRKIIELCQKYHIQFVFQNSPLNQSTYEALNPKFTEEFLSYLKSIQRDYPGARIDTELFYDDNSYFGDRYHLNKKGVIRFCAMMKEKYSDIFYDQ